MAVKPRGLGAVPQETLSGVRSTLDLLFSGVGVREKCASTYTDF